MNVEVEEVTTKAPESEFGKGLTYCLGLFLCHSEREFNRRPGEEKFWRADTWFNAASDHLYELQIPGSLPEPLRIRLTELQDKALSWGHGFGMDGRPKATDADVTWAIKEAKELLRLIDEQFGIATITASWD